MHLRRSRFSSIFVLPHDRVLPHFAQSPVEGNAMQNTTIGNTTVSLPRLDEAGVPVSTLCALFDRAVATAPDDGTVLLPYPIWREAFINDADEALAKSSYDSLSPEPYQ